MIKIKRLSDKIDYNIPYKVMIDGKIIMELKNDELRDYDLEEGEHTIKIISDSFVSEEIKFINYKGQYIEFECRPDHGNSKFSKISRMILLGKLGIELIKKNDFYL
jgi:hypothetical protein